MVGGGGGVRRLCWKVELSKMGENKLMSSFFINVFFKGFFKKFNLGLYFRF